MDKDLKQGTTAGMISSVLAVLGIFFLGIVFVPIALIVGLVGMFRSISTKNISGIIINALALILVLVGFFTSPMLIAIIGIGLHQ